MPITQMDTQWIIVKGRFTLLIRTKWKMQKYKKHRINFFHSHLSVQSQIFDLTLSFFTGSEQVYVSKALQKAKIIVNEDGTKASAATSESLLPFNTKTNTPKLCVNVNFSCFNDVHLVL